MKADNCISIESPFELGRDKYIAFYDTLKTYNESQEHEFLKTLLARILSKKVNAYSADFPSTDAGYHISKDYDNSSSTRMYIIDEDSFNSNMRSETATLAFQNVSVVCFI